MNDDDAFNQVLQRKKVQMQCSEDYISSLQMPSTKHNLRIRIPTNPSVDIYRTVAPQYDDFYPEFPVSLTHAHSDSEDTDEEELREQELSDTFGMTRNPERIFHSTDHDRTENTGYNKFKSKYQRVQTDNEKAHHYGNKDTSHLQRNPAGYLFSSSLADTGLLRSHSSLPDYKHMFKSFGSGPIKDGKESKKEKKDKKEVGEPEEVAEPAEKTE